MNRREFVRLTGSGVAIGAIAEQVVEAQVAGQPKAARRRARARQG